MPLASKPNILLVILDTLRRDRLSLYGHERPTSPALDDFSTGATRYERAISAAQWTIPSHASMFTGLYPSSHNLTQANGALSGMFPTIAEILRGSGYHTAAFCNNPLVGVLNNGLQRGFEQFYNYASAVPHRPGDARKHPLRRAFTRRFRPFARKIGNQFAQNENLFRVALNPVFVPVWTKYINFKGSTPNTISDVIDYWQAHQAGGSDKPLFGFVNLMGAHLPYQPPRPYLDRVAPGLYRDKAVMRFMTRFNADAAAWASPNDPPLQDWEQHALHAFYDAEIAYQDEQLGRLLSWLETSGTLDNTVVMIAADHGEGHGDHEMFGHGFVVNQELVHVPLIIRGEPFAPGAVDHTNLSTRRLFHTMLDLAGVQPPLDDADPNANVAGLSLVRHAAGSHGPEYDSAFSEAIPPLTFLNVIEHRNPVSIDRLRLRLARRGVYRGDHKLTVVGEQVEALYHVPTDSSETHNVAAEQPLLTEDLRAEIDQFVLGAAREGIEPVFAGSFSTAVEDQLRALGYIE